MKKLGRSIPVVICVAVMATFALAQVQGAWVTTNNMTVARSGHAQVTLATGALAARGTDGVNVFASAEIYNAATGKWAATASMTQARESFPAVVLNNGKVLVSGGLGASTSCWLAPSCMIPRREHGLLQVPSPWLALLIPPPCSRAGRY